MIKEERYYLIFFFLSHAPLNQFVILVDDRKSLAIN